MKRTALIFGAMITVLAGSDIVKNPKELKYPPSNYQVPRAADYHHKLDGGSSAYLVEDHQLPVVNLSVTIRTGSYLEPADKLGLSSLVASQIRGGGTKSRPAAQFDEDVAFLAAQLSSFIGPTDGQASMNCLSKDTDACLELFFDMIRNPAFAEDRLKLAKLQTMQGLERRNDSTIEIERREFSRLLRGPDFFANHMPTKSTIDSIVRADLVNFHSKYYFPANFIFAVSGDFNTAEMVAKLNKRMEGWQNQATVPVVTAPAFTPKPGVYVVDKPGVNQGRVMIGEPGITMTNPDHIAVSVMNGILGGSGFTSRIVTRVRSDEGLAYSAGSMFPAGSFYPSIFQSYFQSKSISVAQGIAIIMQEIERIRKDAVPRQEMDVVTASMIDTLPQRFANASAKAAQFAATEYDRLPENYWQTYRDKVRAVTGDDLRRVAQKYLDPSKLVILVVGDAGTIEKGNPDKPEFQLSKFGTVSRVPLPDPLTMQYPQP